MKQQKFIKSVLTLLVTGALSVNAMAQNAPKGEDLEGRVYGGIHALFLDADNDRKATPDVNSTIDSANGYGLELGYRFNPKWEGRIAYTDLHNVSTKHDGFRADDGSMTSFDMLYFPTAQNFYGLGGFSVIDLEDEDLSVNLGAGYRHYFNERFAMYLEGAGHYQFDANMKDLTAQIGMIYFFGGKSQSPAKSAAPVKEAAAVTTAAVAPMPKAKDTDNDGVADSDDLCANTPMTDKVDTEGCTVFTEKTATMELLVNFDNNKSEVKDEYYGELARTAKFLSAYPHVNLVIEGHSSSQGSAKYNKMLSQKRADAVRQKLITNFSVDESRLTAIGYGEERLLDTSDSAQAHETNRRIHAVVETSVKEAVKR